MTVQADADTDLLAIPEAQVSSAAPFFRQVADAFNDAGDSFAERLSLALSRHGLHPAAAPSAAVDSADACR